MKVGVRPVASAVGKPPGTVEGVAVGRRIKRPLLADCSRSVPMNSDTVCMIESEFRA